MSYKYLVIVESPAKAKTIEKYLGKNYKVVASLGHVRDLPKSRMGIDIEHNYEPHYISIRGKGPVIKELKSYAKKAEKVYLAADPDREGEAIAWHLAHLLDLDLSEKNRVVFNEITKDAVKQAFKEPRQIDLDLVDAQQARRVLDRLVGYSISPLLWRKVKKGLSAGRVQSVALNMIHHREQEINAFKPEEYWSLEGLFQVGQDTFSANFVSINGKKKKLLCQSDVDDVLSLLSTQNLFYVDDLEKKQRKRNAPKPFTTSSLQQEASKKINFRTKKTMMIAQQLYEGVSLGRKGTVGLITYMRTDSTRIAPSAQKEVNAYILEHFGKDYAGSFSKSEIQKGAQDAHEAIRPTSVLRTPESLEPYLDKDQMKLYRLIWERFVASHMSAAIFDTVKMSLIQNKVLFQATGSILVFPGFMRVYKDQKDEDKDRRLPNVVQGQGVHCLELEGKQHFTQPPARYGEASLVKTLEEKGVGRPSTYAPTLDTLQKRYYVKLNQKRFEPTELGMIVNDMMTTFFPNIVDVQFTAGMEHQLDQIEAGKLEWVEVIDEFYQPFSKELEKAEDEIEKIEIKDEPAGFDCELCGHPMVIKIGRYGKFYACSNFPECRNTQPIVKEIGVTCPTCHQGQVVERKSKKNRLFYGCSRYPECDFVSWDKPLPRNCPKCNHYLIEKKVKGGKQVQCSHCSYKEDIQK